MEKGVVAGIIRAILASVAGALAAKGVIEASMVEPIVGAILLLGTTAWSVISKKR